MNRDKIIECMDANNARIKVLQDELKECYKLDKRLAALLLGDEVNKTYTYKGEPLDQQWVLETAVKLNDLARRDTEKWGYTPYEARDEMESDVAEQARMKRDRPAEFGSVP